MEYGQTLMVILSVSQSASSFKSIGSYFKNIGLVYRTNVIIKAPLKTGVYDQIHKMLYPCSSCEVQYFRKNHFKEFICTLRICEIFICRLNVYLC